MQSMRVNTNIDSTYLSAPRRSPLTKQVNQVAYELPGSAYSNPWSYAPEFMKVFGDQRVHIGSSCVFDCVLLGTPRPKVTWLFNEHKLPFTDVEIIDTCDLCQLRIGHVRPEHYGIYTVIAENEMGRAIASATLVHP